jgi:hypothetical protein
MDGRKDCGVGSVPGPVFPSATSPDWDDASYSDSDSPLSSLYFSHSSKVLPSGTGSVCLVLPVLPVLPVPPVPVFFAGAPGTSGTVLLRSCFTESVFEAGASSSSLLSPCAARALDRFLVPTVACVACVACRALDRVLGPTVACAACANCSPCAPCSRVLDRVVGAPPSSDCVPPIGGFWNLYILP